MAKRKAAPKKPPKLEASKLTGFKRPECCPLSRAAGGKRASGR